MTGSIVLLLSASDPCPGAALIQSRASAARVRLLTATVLNALPEIDRIRPALVLLDAAECDISALGAICARAGPSAVVLIARESSEALAVAALNAGVARYLRSPLTPQAIDAAFADLIRHDPPELIGEQQLVGRSVGMRALRTSIQRASACSSNVLITGETGTGKELVAELIHTNSARRDRPFVCLNSTAIPDSLLESELFGYERGAFTGAYAANVGKLAMGNTGTVFFDEIGDISGAVQAKLLRALDGKLIYRLGGNKPAPLDIRVVAATNQDLEAAVRENHFRSDLYYRLNVVRLEVPPLRGRLEDIPVLVDHFIAKFNPIFGTRVERFSDEAISSMRSHDWPGNVRELKNVVEAAFVHLGAGDSRIAALPPQFRTGPDSGFAGECNRILRALRETEWNKTRAAEQLHWSRMTLYRKLIRYGIATAQEPRPARSDRKKVG